MTDFKTASDFFDWMHARATDVDTSHAAVPKDLTKQARRVLRAYADGTPLMDGEAYRRVGLEGHQRCSDLRHEGFIERVGRGKTDFGKMGYKCIITKAGLDYLAKS